jgi:hypothetical protein
MITGFDGVLLVFKLYTFLLYILYAFMWDEAGGRANLVAQENVHMETAQFGYHEFPVDWMGCYLPWILASR